MPRILIVDDDAHIAASLAERFTARGHAVTVSPNGKDGLARIRREPPDVVLLDLQMPEMDGFAVLAKLKEEDIDTTVIVITAHGSLDRAVKAMQSGAYDFLQKPFEPSLVEETVRRALERSDLKRENRALRLDLPPLIYGDPKMTQIIELARKTARSDASVLLLGESGTGKEVLARHLHAWSPRAPRPFIAVNCVALNENLLESELFGHEKGAFTGATARRTGKIELADTGTLFLDEIGDISAAFQAKLLRVLQERCFERVGGNESIAVDVRVIAATNKDLKRLVAEGRFREDLYYRLNVISVQVPSLRERPGDLVRLAEHFLGGRAALTDEAKGAIRAYAWPGNVRELKNAVERAVVLCEGGRIMPADLPADVLEAPGAAPSGGFHDLVEAERRRILKEALDACGGNQTKAADKLGLQRTYLARLIKQLGLRDEA